MRQDLDVARPAVDLSKLTQDEKLELIGELWDSLDDAAVALTSEQRREIDRRVANLDANGPSGSSWEEVEARVRTRAR